MGGLTERIAPGSLVGVDTAIFIYQIEAVQPYASMVAPFFEALARGELRAVTSVITLMEIAVRPLQLERPEVADDYELLLLNFPHLRVIDVDRRIGRRAASLRAQYRLSPADSLQMATALESGAQTFITNDRRLSRVQDIQTLVLDTVLEEP